MNYQIPQMFVVKAGQALYTSGSTSNLATGQVGVFDKNFTAISGSPSVSSNPFIFLAQGSGDNKIGTFKSSKIYLNKVTKWFGSKADLSSQEQITYVGFDQINDCKSPSISCDKSYTIVLRVHEHYLNTVYCPALQEGIVVKSPCCDSCGSNCDSLNCYNIFKEFETKINENPRLKNYVSAEAVYKLISGSPVTKKFSIVLPDPGTSLGVVTDFTYTTAAAGLTNGTYTAVATTSAGAGTGATFNVTVTGGVVTAVALNAAGTGYEIDEVLTIAGTSITSGTDPADNITITVTATTGAEGLLLSEIRTFYSSLVANAETDIVYSTDVDSSDNDTNATGNVMIEMTPLTTVSLEDVEYFNGVAWTELPCQDASTAVYACGLKLTGITPAGFESDCLPDSTAYIANKTRFNVYAGELPSGSQDVDLFDNCNLWSVDKTQEITFPVGAGYAIAEMERNFRGSLMPFNYRYNVPFYNQTTYFVDKSLTYDLYHIWYQDPSSELFETRTPLEIEVIIAVPSTETAFKSSLETILNGYFANTPAVFPSVNL